MFKAFHQTQVYFSIKRIFYTTISVLLVSICFLDAPKISGQQLSSKNDQAAKKKGEPTKLEVVGCITSGKGTVTIPINTSIDRGKSVTVPIQGLYTWVNHDGKDPITLRLFLAGQLLVNHKPSLIQV